MSSFPAPQLLATLQANLDRVQRNIASTLADAGRPAGSARLLPVTKSVSPETALALASLLSISPGPTALAENRLDKLIAKRAYFAAANCEVEWHFIGHLQRNKARKVLQNAHVLHSVDSERLLRTIARVALEEQLQPELYLEVKLSAEPEKHGLDPAELEACVRIAGAAPQLKLRGLMTMAPRPTDGCAPRSGAEPCFNELARLARELCCDPQLRDCFVGETCELSMGMSSDYEVALRAGSHVCRVGGALFSDVEGVAR